MSSFQQWLERANERYGGVGSVVTAVILLTVLTYALIHILGDYW